MASTASLRRLYQQHQSEAAKSLVRVGPKSVTVTPLSVSASSGQPYDAGSSGRRFANSNPSRLGPSTSLWGSLDLMRARCRDEVRNNPWAASAVDNFESQVIGTGIRPHWNIEDKELKRSVEKEFSRWARSVHVDTAGLSNFYGLQCLCAREIFESGEVFIRRYIRPSSWKMRIPLQLQILEGEQIPVFKNIWQGSGDVAIGMPAGNSVRCGIEFDPSGRRGAYHMYASHPGETMFYPLEGLTFTRVPATDVLHSFKPFRAGQLRGQPHLAAVLLLLRELDEYTDATVVKKKIQTMFAGFIQKIEPTADILPQDLTSTPASSQNVAPVGQTAEQLVGVQTSQLETGSMQVLLPGETITFPQLPSENDFESFLSVELHKFAVGVGATYEQLTGDLKGVNLSSIRAGILDFRRKCEQFQLSIIVAQILHPLVTEWWLPEAVMSGAVKLPGYASDPGLYEDISWGLPGWPWIDPLKDVQAKQAEVRCGFDSRENVVAEKGGDVAVIDAQQATDNKRSDAYGLVLDSRPDQVLVKAKVHPNDDPTVQQQLANGTLGEPAGSSGSGGSDGAVDPSGPGSATEDPDIEDTEGTDDQMEAG